MNHHYLHYSVEDFIADEAFQHWVRFPDPETDRAWKEWFDAHPLPKQKADLAASFLQNLRFDHFEPSPAEINRSLENNLRKIEAAEQTRRAPTIPSFAKKLLIAAAVVTTLVSAWFAYTRFQTQDPVMIELVTGAGEIKTILLPDSSTVTLNEHSSITYSSALGKTTTRELWMDGEVFFNVRHIQKSNTAARRFHVYSGDLKVEVVGTSFNIKRYNSRTNVSLNNGQIKVGVKDDPVSVTLQPGDFIQYLEKDKKLVKRKVDAGLYSTWKEKKVKLDKMPVTEIAQLIQDIYGYEVRFNDPELRSGRMTGTLLVNDEKTFLATLAFALDIDITKKDSTLIFSSKTKLKKE